MYVIIIGVGCFCCCTWSHSMTHTHTHTHNTNTHTTHKHTHTHTPHTHTPHTHKPHTPTHTHTHTHTSGLLWMRDRPVAENYTWPHTTFTKDRLRCPRGIRFHNPKKGAAADPRLRPCGHWDRPLLQLYFVNPIVHLHINNNKNNNNNNSNTVFNVNVVWSCYSLTVSIVTFIYSTSCFKLWLTLRWQKYFGKKIRRSLISITI